MSKFTFVCEHDNVFGESSLAKLTLETNRVRLDDILEDLEDFLAGCGYVIDGELQIVKDEPITLDFGTGMYPTMADDTTMFCATGEYNGR